MIFSGLLILSTPTKATVEDNEIADNQHCIFISPRILDADEVSLIQENVV